MGSPIKPGNLVFRGMQISEKQHRYCRVPEGRGLHNSHPYCFRTIEKIVEKQGYIHFAWVYGRHHLKRRFALGVLSFLAIGKWSLFIGLGSDGIKGETNPASIPIYSNITLKLCDNQNTSMNDKRC